MTDNSSPTVSIHSIKQNFSSTPSKFSTANLGKVIKQDIQKFLGRFAEESVANQEKPENYAVLISFLIVLPVIAIVGLLF